MSGRQRQKKKRKRVRRKESGRLSKGNHMTNSLTRSALMCRLAPRHRPTSLLVVQKAGKILWGRAWERSYNLLVILRMAA